MSRHSVLIILTFAAFAFAQDVPSAFTDVPSARAPQRIGSTAGVRRFRAVEMNAALFDEAAASTFRRPGVLARKPVKFNLFDGSDLTVEFDKVDHSGIDGNTLVWSGNVNGNRMGQIVMAVTGQIHSANITTDNGELYSLRPSGTGNTHWIQQGDASTLPPEAEPRRAPPSELNLSPRIALSDDGSVIDVMVVYTAAARQAAGGTTQMQNLVALGISETNQGYANSGVAQRVRLVNTSEVSYTESGDFNTDLSRLTSTNDGFMDNVHTLRNQYAADVVSLWVETGNYCGLAWLMTDTVSNFASRAFSVVARTCATGYYSFGHEMGHNFGSTHDIANSGGPGVFAYSYGYQQKVTAPFFRTIMAYQCSGSVNCPRQNFWSTPDNTYQSLATGVSNSNNVLSLNNTRTITANWRASVASFSLSPASATAGNSSGTGFFNITGPGGTAWNAVSNASWITSSSAGAGNGVVNYSFLANTSTSPRSGTISVAGLTFNLTQSGNTATCTSMQLAIPQTVTDSINSSCTTTNPSSGFVKRYSFSGTAAQQVSISVVSSGVTFSPVLTLISPIGTSIATDSNALHTLSARIPSTGSFSLPSTGVYTLEVFSTQNSGNYTLSLQNLSGCTYTISPTTRTIDANVNTGSVSVTAPAGCAWTATTNVSWISITSTGAGAGSDTLLYTATANPDNTSRFGALTIAGQVLALTQSGQPSTCNPSAISPGQTLTSTLSSGGCRSLQRGSTFIAQRYQFTATAGQGVSIALTSPTLDTYLYLIGPNGNVIAQDDDSAGNLNSRIPPTGALTLTQSGTYIIEATTFDQNAAGAITVQLTAGCGFALSTYSATFPSSASSTTINVTSLSGCVWQTVSNSIFITVASGGTANGSGAVTLNIAQNPGSLSRRGTVTIGGNTLVIVQSGTAIGCQTSAITSGVTRTSSLDTSDCYSIGRGSGYYAERYTFSATVGQQLSISVDSTSFDTYVYLIDPTGSVALSNDDGGPDTNSRLPADNGTIPAPATGTFTIEVTSFGLTSAGSYTIRLDTTGSPSNGGQGPFRLISVTPCRIMDTRVGSGFSGPFGSPAIASGSFREVPVTQSGCAIPTEARAFSLNVTVVPRGALSYITVWPADLPQPFVSTLNSPLGRIIANAAIVPASSAGAIRIFASDTTDLIIDINGYFAP